MAVLAKHMFDPVEPPRQRAPERGIPEDVEAVILRALAKERDDRFPSMAALAEAIVATLPDQPAAALWLEASRESPMRAPEDEVNARGETLVAPAQRPALAAVGPQLDPSATLVRRRPSALPTLTLSLAALALGVLTFVVLRSC
jgi:serine/threonine-protein kinase